MRSRAPTGLYPHHLLTTYIKYKHFSVPCIVVSRQGSPSTSQRQLLYTENQSWWLILKSHNKYPGLCLGSSRGLANRNDDHKPPVDFKDVFTSIKVTLRVVASIAPTTAVADFLSWVPCLFLAAFIAGKKKITWSCSHRQKYSSLRPYSLCSSIISHLSTSQSLMWWFWQVLPPVLCWKQTALKKASCYLFATRTAFFVSPSTCQE